MLARAPAIVRTPTEGQDPLAGLALEYSARSARFIAARSATAPAVGPTDARPAAAETVLWFHSRIYFTTTRALVGKALAAQGALDRREDANRCARQTLVAVDRSRAALEQFTEQDVERGALVALLDAIALGIEERFACARSVAAVPTDGNRDARPHPTARCRRDGGTARARR